MKKRYFLSAIALLGLGAPVAVSQVCDQFTLTGPNSGVQVLGNLCPDGSIQNGQVLKPDGSNMAAGETITYTGPGGVASTSTHDAVPSLPRHWEELAGFPPPSVSELSFGTPTHDQIIGHGDLNESVFGETIFFRKDNVLFAQILEDVVLPQPTGGLTDGVYVVNDIGHGSIAAFFNGALSSDTQIKGFGGEFSDLISTWTPSSGSLTYHELGVANNKWIANSDTTQSLGTVLRKNGREVNSIDLDAIGFVGSDFYLFSESDKYLVVVDDNYNVERISTIPGKYFNGPGTFTAIIQGDFNSDGQANDFASVFRIATSGNSKYRFEMFEYDLNANSYSNIADITTDLLSGAPHPEDSLSGYGNSIALSRRRNDGNQRMYYWKVDAVGGSVYSRNYPAN